MGYRNIYIVTYDKNLKIEGCITIDENIYPFNKDTVIKFHGKNKWNNWYYQQLLKLYAGREIKGILDIYLVIDSDTYFLKKTKFIENDKYLYCYGKENHKQYFYHMKIMHESLEKVDKNKSGICHHMIFDKKYLNELFSLIENKHKDKFYKIFLKSVKKEYIEEAGASEYEIYFNYMLKYHSDKINIRNLKWKNANKIEEDYDYVSIHYYKR